MKRKRLYMFATLILVVLLGVGYTIFFKSSPPPTPYNRLTTYPLQPTGASRHAPTSSRSIFVPYWAGEVSQEDRKYDMYYYFGIRPLADGTIENEAGLQNMPMMDKIPEKQKKLVIRMLDASITEAILQEKTVQKTFISQIQTIVSKNSFSGIVLDLEVSFTLQASKKEQITQFVQQICTKVKTDYRTCGVLVYGDATYRGRPYDLRALGKATDSILLMAYDFHKAGGEPGPNFSFDDRQNYGYDFKQMISDTIALVTKDKVEVVFGMFGYDWTLNEQGMPLKGAEALSLNSLKLKAESLRLKAESSNLKESINSAREKSFKYVDSEGLKHIVWYEDEESAAVKTKYLQSVGIGRVSYWAYNYY